MLTTFEKNLNVFVSVISFLVLNLQTCYGYYTCYQMSSGKDICFMLDASQQTIEESKQFCKNNGGFLLEIYNLEMLRFVEQFGKNKTIYLGNAWLNLVRTNSNVWVWGGEGSGNYLTYTNWESSNPLPSGSNIAFMNPTYKWQNTYSIQEASTICIKGNPTTYSSETSTTTTTTTTPTTSSSSSSSSTSTIILIIQPTQITATYTTTTTSSSAIGIGVGVELGGLVLIIVSSLLIAKFVFHKEIPLPFKSSTSSKSPPRETGSDVINGDYEHIDKTKLTDRSPYTVLSVPRDPNSTLNYVGFQDLIQPNSASGLEGPSKTDYGTPLS